MIRRITALLCGLLLLAGCGGQTEAPAGSATSSDAPAGTAASEPSTAASPAPASSEPALSGTLNVYAAASLTKTFTAIGEEFMAQHPGVKVEFVFAGSSDLVAQLDAGAPGDVFASADERNMTKATDAGLIDGAPSPFVTNNLTIVTAPGNPHGIAGLADLANPDLKIVVCAPQVPCGGATQKVAELAGVTLAPVSEETSVTNVLGKVTAGEADAGLVYRTDAKGAGDGVTAVDFPEADEVTNVYPIGPLKAAQNPEAAQAFIDMVLGEEGQKILNDAGFNTINA